MRFLVSAAAILAAIALSGCSGGGDGFGDLRQSVGANNFSRGGDTYGTQRRVDVYGASTAPSLPTIGAPGYGK